MLGNVGLTVLAYFYQPIKFLMSSVYRKHTHQWHPEESNESQTIFMTQIENKHKPPEWRWGGLQPEAAIYFYGGPEIFT